MASRGARRQQIDAYELPAFAAGLALGVAKDIRLLAQTRQLSALDRIAEAVTDLEQHIERWRQEESKWYPYRRK
jgi:hypothetical protein